VSYLVTVSPEVVLGADVLVRVLGPLRAGILVLLVSDVLPVGIPPNLGVDAGDDDAGDGDADMNVSGFPPKYLLSVPMPCPSYIQPLVRLNAPSSPSPLFFRAYVPQSYVGKTYKRDSLRQSSPDSAACCAMWARSRLNSLSSAPANCLGLSEL
jgi:hypothetical protein